MSKLNSKYGVGDFVCFKTANHFVEVEPILKVTGFTEIGSVTMKEIDGLSRISHPYFIRHATEQEIKAGRRIDEL